MADPVLGPFVTAPGYQALVIVVGSLFTVCYSGHVVRKFIGQAPVAPDDADQPLRSSTAAGYDIHAVIGKCENLLTLLFVLAGEFTGLALIFAAKSLVRAQDIHRSPGYYLGGTMVNLVWSILMATVVKVLVQGGP